MCLLWSQPRRFSHSLSWWFWPKVNYGWLGQKQFNKMIKVLYTWRRVFKSLFTKTEGFDRRITGIRLSSAWESVTPKLNRSKMTMNNPRVTCGRSGLLRQEGIATISMRSVKYGEKSWTEAQLTQKQARWLSTVNPFTLFLSTKQHCSQCSYTHNHWSILVSATTLFQIRVSGRLTHVFENTSPIPNPHFKGFHEPLGHFSHSAPNPTVLKLQIHNLPYLIPSCGTNSVTG